MDVLGPLAGFAERFFGNRERRRATNTRIGDKARQLRRQLLASFEEWEWGTIGPKTVEDLARWAAQKFAAGYRVTEPALRELVDLRADASHHVRQLVGTARDHYDAAAALVNPLIKSGVLTVCAANRGLVEGELRQAVAHVRTSLAALDTLTKSD